MIAYALLVCTHLSDVTRGAPFNDQPEPWLDYCGAGVTLVIEKAPVEIDLSHGIKRYDWPTGVKREQGSQLTVRWYPGKNHRQ